MSYDVIGDVHGQHDKLTALLSRLGYRETDGAWRHPGRTAVFVGDLIDRGPRQVATVNLVRRMVDAGSALCIMGNHEFNAIAWHTRDPERPARFLRRHDRLASREQHAAFLAEVEGQPLHDELTGWFRSLPLWLDLGSLRVVHACWDEHSMACLSPSLNSRATFTDALLAASARRGEPAFVAVETLCKGVEVDLPPGVFFHDKDGTRREQVRVRWWMSPQSSFREAAFVPDAVRRALPETALPADPRIGGRQGVPVFFGHYWLRGVPAPLAPNMACVDYSAGGDGALVAYRFDGEERLASSRFVAA